MWSNEKTTLQRPNFSKTPKFELKPSKLPEGPLKRISGGECFRTCGPTANLSSAFPCTHTNWGWAPTVSWPNSWPTPQQLKGWPTVGQPTPPPGRGGGSTQPTFQHFCLEKSPIGRTKFGSPKKVSAFARRRK